jgi:WD40 repeat protein
MSLAFSPDGTLLASTGHDDRCQVWDVKNGSVRFVFEQAGGGVAFDPQVTRLACGGRESVVLFDIVQGREIGRYQPQSSPPRAVAFSPDGKRLLVGRLDGRVQVCDVPSDDAVDKVFGTVASAPNESVRFQLMNSLMKAGELTLLQAEREGIAINVAVAAVAFSPDGRYAAASGWDRSLRVWDAASGREMFSILGHSGPVTCFAYSPDGRRLVTGSYDQEEQMTGRGDHVVRLWDATTGQEPIVRDLGTRRAGPVCFRADSAVLAVGADREVLLYDGRTHERIGVLTGHLGRVTDIQFCDGGRRIMTGSADGTARLWDVKTGVTGRTIGTPQETNSLSGYRAACDPAGRRIATGSSQVARVTLWDARTGGKLREFDTGMNGVYSVALSPDGGQLAAGCFAKAPDGAWAQLVQVWDTDGRGGPLVLDGHHDGPGGITAVSFSPDGKRLVSAAVDHTARVWDLAAGVEVHTLRGHTKGLFAANHGWAGRRVVTCAFDGTVRLWDAASGLELLALPGRYFQAASAAMSPDGGSIASTWNDGTLRVWDLRPWTEHSRDELEARGLLTHLRSRGLDAAAVTEAVRIDPTITEGVREFALELAAGPAALATPSP